MLIPIICFAIAGILLIVLIAILVRGNAETKDGVEDSPVEQLSEKPIEEVPVEVVAINESEDAPVIDIEPVDETVDEPIEQVTAYENEQQIVEEVPVTKNEVEQPNKIEDSSYREALKKFQEKKPELVKEKRHISDTDYRNALLAMKKKGE